jgi:FlaA1/EpsC-like NDP-sugar epimerase
VLLARGRHLAALDVVASGVAFFASFALRFDAPSEQFDSFVRAYLWALPLLIAFRMGSFLRLGLYQRVWRYASVEELVAVLIAVVGSSIAAYLVIYALVVFGAAPQVPGVPRSIPIIESSLMFILAGGWRFAFRIFGVGRRVSPGAGLDRAVIVGSGSTAVSVIRELVAPSGQPSITPVGILADDLSPGQRLMGLSVLGSTADLAEVIKRERVAVVLLGLPSADGRTIRRFVRIAEAAGARCLTVPSVAEVIAGRVSTNALREVDVEDLLRRAPARIDLASIGETFRGKRILVTGAGGSIGSELVRQLTRFSPSELVLLGRGETSIFEAMQTVATTSTLRITPVILDIREAARLEALFLDLRPDVVFHAAAHKHVHLMEIYPEEAVATNILGTVNALAAAARSGVERFILISSDKAVNPRSVMGVTKRVAELVVRDAALRTGHAYASVRFGNVLSSRGSVVPIFRQQLEHGGPLTVTDASAQRFFMTIPEAVQLVLQAAVLARPADSFVLDMGEPVRIVDLARDLLRLHGMTEGDDIEIVYTGLGQGEKLVEELLFSFEHVEPTAHEAVLRIAQSSESSPVSGEQIQELAELIHPMHRARIIELLGRLVPQFEPAVLWSTDTARPARSVGTDLDG